MDADPSQYRSIAQERGIDLVDLAEMTHPNIDLKYSERFDLEDRISQGTLTAEERIAMLFEPFLILEPRVQKRCHDVNIDVQTGLLGAITIALIVTFVIAAFATTTGAGSIYSRLAWITAGVGFITVIFSMITDSRRFIRRKVFPTLATALHPLKPTSDELDSTIQRLQEARTKIGKKIRPQELHDFLTSYEQLGQITGR